MPKPMNRTGMRDVFLQDFQGTRASVFTPANSLAGNIRAISAYPRRHLGCNPCANGCPEEQPLAYAEALCCFPDNRLVHGSQAFGICRQEDEGKRSTLLLPAGKRLCTSLQSG